jgi:CelD/BcsL family acetyltransferase involved in cellulose biosynthesis
MTLRPETLTQAADLASLRAAWDELLADSATNEPTLSFDWQAAWWEVFGPTDGRSLLVLLWYDGPRLVGLLPLQRRRVRYSGVVPFARLEILASGEDEEDEICSEYLNPVLRRGYEERLAVEIAAALSRRSDWDEIVLPSLDGSQPVASLLKSAFEGQGYRTECEEIDACPYIPLPDTWAAYLAALPSQRRYLITRSLRDFEEWAQGKQVLRRASSRDELEEGRAILAGLHGERWLERRRGGVFASSRFRRFHELMMPRLLDRGALDLWWLEVNRRPVAAVYNFAWDNKVHFYQSGRATDLPKKVRIGIVAHALVMQRAIAEGRREYDFLAGTTQYKMQMALSTRPLWRLRVVRSESRERLRLGMERPRRIARALAGRFSARWPGLLPLPKAVGRAGGGR